MQRQRHGQKGTETVSETDRNNDRHGGTDTAADKETADSSRMNIHFVSFPLPPITTPGCVRINIGVKLFLSMNVFDCLRSSLIGSVYGEAKDGRADRRTKLLSRDGRTR